MYLSYVWSNGGIIATGKTEVVGEKPVPILFYRPQILHGLVQNPARASAARGQRLTAILSLYSLNLSVSKTQDQCVYYAVQAEYLGIVQLNLVLSSVWREL
jgi:hypothetical protein